MRPCAFQYDPGKVNTLTISFP